MAHSNAPDDNSTKDISSRRTIWKSPDGICTIIHSPDGEYWGEDKLYHYFLYIKVPNYTPGEILSLGAESRAELGNKFRCQAREFVTPGDGDWKIAYYHVTQYIIGNLKKSERIIPEMKWNTGFIGVKISTIGEGDNLLDHAYSISVRSAEKESLVSTQFNGVYSLSKIPTEEEKKDFSKRVVDDMEAVNLYVDCVRNVLSRVYTTLYNYFEDPATHERIFEIKAAIHDRYAKLVSKLQSYLRPDGVLLDKYEEAIEQFSKENRDDLLELDKLIEPASENDNGFRLPPPPPEIPALKNL